MENSLTEYYSDKREDYFDCDRPEMRPFIPDDCKSILDVGCGRGFFAASLRQVPNRTIWGIEPDKDCIPIAEKNLDKIIHGCFEPDLRLPEGHFDCIIFNDVLEHLLDPDTALIYAMKLLKNNGIIVASIPNILHFPIMWKLVTRGEWTYTERGILDKTHLRFYTRKSIATMFTQLGYQINRIDGINPYHSMEPEDEKLWRYYKLLEKVPMPSVHDMRYLQFSVIAKKITS